VNRLMQRLDQLEQIILPKGRVIAIHDDGFEDIEARIERCRAAVGITFRDLIVIMAYFSDPDDEDRWRAPEPPWTVQQMIG
jgi:hypothetical protein